MPLLFWILTIGITNVKIQRDYYYEKALEYKKLWQDLSNQMSCAEGFAPPEWHERYVHDLEKELDELESKWAKHAETLEQ